MKIDSILESEMQKLKNEENIRIGYTKLTCMNYGVHSTAYLFWIKENSVLIQKFKYSENDDDSLKKFKPIEIDDTIFFDFYETNKEKLKLEKVEHFIYKPDSIVGKTIYSHRISRSHSCYRNFVIRTEDENFHKFFNYFDVEEFDGIRVMASSRKYTNEEKEKWRERGWKGMETEIIYANEPKRNINFEQNNKLKLVEWDKILIKLIDGLESKNTFELMLKSE